VATRFEVLVLGGGPAGAAAATELAHHGISVAVLERGGAPAVRGETLSPGAMPWLRQLGAWEAFRGGPHLASPGVVSLWNTRVPAEVDFLFNPYGPGWHIDRGSFDTLLLAGARQTGARILTGARPRRCWRTESGTWTLAVAVFGRQEVFEAGWLIDATGRRRWLLHRLGCRIIALDRLVGVIAHFSPHLSVEHRLILEATREGWWYYAPLPQGRAIAAYMTDGHSVPREEGARRQWWANHWSSSQLIARVLGSSPIVGPLQVRPANTSWAVRATGPGWLAVGDAALTHDPLSGNGICHGLASGMHAARAILDAIGGDGGALERYQALADATRTSYLRTRDEHYQSVSTWPTSRFWQCQVGSASPRSSEGVTHGIATPEPIPPAR
jgi:flavin-dependent dehydrogenase